MSETTEKLELKCPICKETHEYSINVDRSLILYSLFVPSSTKSTKRTVKKFKRVFVCPVKNEQFQAIITMEEGFGEIINDVSVNK